MPYDYYNARDRVRKVLEANGFGWEEPAYAADIIRSRTATGLGSRDNEIETSLRSYKFRRLLYWLVDKRSTGPFTIELLSQKTGLNKEQLQEYLDLLDFHRLVNHIDDKWHLASEVCAESFSPTLEWYVAQRFNEDLHWQAAWRVHLKDFAYNDFDVIATRGQRIVVVECKLTNPEHIEEHQIEAFFERHRFLSPDFSLFLVDTNSAVQALADRIKAVIERTGQHPGLIELDPKGNAFYISSFVYVANTNVGNDSLLRSMQTCLRHYHSKRRVAVWG